MNNFDDFFAGLNEIFNPANNPMFAPSRNDDNIEDAEIIEEIKGEGYE